MAFKRDSLATLLDRTYASYMTRLKPIAQTSRYNIIKVLSAVDAGVEHQILGDISFLADQLFPDTATGDYLRAHWSDRVPPLYATAAVGYVRQTGVPGAAVPSGMIYESAAGKRYFTSTGYTVGNEGYVDVYVSAETAGVESEIGEGTELTIVSSLVTGIESKAKVANGGIYGGIDNESDEEYLARVIAYLRGSTRYGKPGDFAAWATDSSIEVSKAFEIRNFGIFGALLIQVIHGNQIDGVSQVSGISTVTNYIDKKSPPIIFTVRTPELIPLNPKIQLLPNEDTIENRATVLSRIQVYMNARAEPGSTFTQAQLQSVIIDGEIISSATLTLDGGEIATTVLQYPVVGEITWN